MVWNVHTRLAVQYITVQCSAVSQVPGVQGPFSLAVKGRALGEELSLISAQILRRRPSHHHVLGGHTAVRASNVEVLGVLRVLEALERLVIDLQRLLNPAPVVFEDVIRRPVAIFSHYNERMMRWFAG